MAKVALAVPSEAMCAACRSCVACIARDTYQSANCRGFEDTSAPVRFVWGNSASAQLQLDVYGEVADALANMARANLLHNSRSLCLRKKLTEHVASIRNKPAFGIWERRNHQDHFTYSKVMAWLALDHGVKAAESAQINRNIRTWKRERDRLHRQICERGFNRRLGTFVQAYGSRKIDASALLIPIFGFLPFKDERIVSTI